MPQNWQHSSPVIVIESGWVAFIERTNERLIAEMREAQSVEENLRNACFIDGSKISVKTWGEM